jgi:hypothetical protein
VKLYTDDHHKPEMNARHWKLLEERFNNASLPYYATLTPDDQVIGTFEGMTENTEDFAKFLQKARNQ